jgi:hypothetical protein
VSVLLLLLSIGALQAGVSSNNNQKLMKKNLKKIQEVPNDII